MACLICAESAIFIIFIVAYLYYLGKSLTGPTPHDVLEIPIFTSICLFSSSATVHFAVSALHQRQARRHFALAGRNRSARRHLPRRHRARVVPPHLPRSTSPSSTNLFGTTFYSLVGLHATHVIVGLIMLSLALIFSLTGSLTSKHTGRLEVLSLYWHFVDAVWVVVFTVVYILGR